MLKCESKGKATTQPMSLGPSVNLALPITRQIAWWVESCMRDIYCSDSDSEAQEKYLTWET